MEDYNVDRMHFGSLAIDSGLPALKELPDGEQHILLLACDDLAEPTKLTPGIPCLCSGLAGFLQRLGIPAEHAKTADAALTRHLNGYLGDAPNIFAAQWDVSDVFEIMLFDQDRKRFVGLLIELTDEDELH